MIVWHDSAPFYRGRSSGTATFGPNGLQMRNADDSRTCDLVDLPHDRELDAPAWATTHGDCRWGDLWPLTLVEQWRRDDALVGVL